MMTRSPTFTINAINEYGGYVYQMTSDPVVAWKVFVEWRQNVINGKMSFLAVEPRIPVLESDEAPVPGQLYVEKGLVEIYRVRVANWSVSAIIRRVKDHLRSIDVWDDYMGTTRFTARYEASARAAINVSIEALRGLALIDGVNLSNDVLYRVDALPVAF